MKNYVQPGNVLTLTAPYAVNSGDGVKERSIFGVACATAALGAEVEVRTNGVFDLTALSTDVATQGAKLYWDNTNRRLTVTATSNTLVGAATRAKASGDTTARVKVDASVR